MSVCQMTDADFAKAFPSVGARASVLAATLDTVSQDLLALVTNDLRTNDEALRVSENVIVSIALEQSDRLTGAKVVEIGKAR